MGSNTAVVQSAYDAFARWNKKRKFWPDGPAMRVVNIVLTFHAVAFGLLIFSGRLSPHLPPRHEEIAEALDCTAISGYVWENTMPNEPLHIDFYIDDGFVGRYTAGELRTDLRDRGYGNGLHGFTFTVPEYLKDGRAHVIEAKVVENGRTVHNTPDTLTCPHP